RSPGEGVLWCIATEPTNLLFVTAAREVPHAHRAPGSALRPTSGGKPAPRLPCAISRKSKMAWVEILQPRHCRFGCACRDVCPRDCHSIPWETVVHAGVASCCICSGHSRPLVPSRDLES